MNCQYCEVVEDHHDINISGDASRELRTFADDLTVRDIEGWELVSISGLHPTRRAVMRRSLSPAEAEAVYGQIVKIAEAA